MYSNLHPISLLRRKKKDCQISTSWLVLGTLLNLFGCSYSQPSDDRFRLNQLQKDLLRSPLRGCLSESLGLMRRTLSKVEKILLDPSG
jgi:hypothetical protein